MFALLRSSRFHCATNSQFIVTPRNFGRHCFVSIWSGESPKIALPLFRSVAPWTGLEKSAHVNVAYVRYVRPLNFAPTNFALVRLASVKSVGSEALPLS